MIIKKRLDQLLCDQYPDKSKNYLQSLIMQGKVKVNDKVVTKPGTAIAVDAVIVTDMHEPKYVSRAGFKLEKALEYFDISVQGLTALDAGLSTGGFTDCLLQRGIAKVYGVDVGYGQVHEKVLRDARLISMERTNLKELAPLPEPVDVVTLDLSFISVLKVMHIIARELKSDGKLIILIKPQFEADRADVGKGGIIKDSAVWDKVIQRVTAGIITHGFVCKGVIESPILGGSGNKEFLGLFEKSANL